jgi:hypothetical protein
MIFRHSLLKIARLKQLPLVRCATTHHCPNSLSVA